MYVIFLKFDNLVLKTVWDNVMQIKVFPAHNFLDSDILDSDST